VAVAEIPTVIDRMRPRLASGHAIAIGRQRRRRRKSAKVQLPTDDRGKTIEDGSSSRTLSTPFSFGNCLMPAVELDAARLVGGSEADRSRVLKKPPAVGLSGRCSIMKRRVNGDHSLTARA
jgi:hypothetical protein